MARKIVWIGSAALMAGILGAVCAPVALAAAGSAASELTEVVVTAERRTENLQNVPVTVTAVSSDELAAANISNVLQLSALVPSLSVVDPTGYTMAFIRGIGSSTLGGGTFSSVAVYIDGVYVARTTNAMFELDSAESVQVLAGPQGSLYGRNATAGAIVITSRKPNPGDPLSGSLSTGLGSYNQRDFSATLSGGLNDRLALSVSAAKHNRNGFITNLDPQGSLSRDDLDGRDAVSSSAMLVYKPTDRATLSLRAAYSQSNDSSGGGYQAVGLNVAAPASPYPNSPGLTAGLNDNQAPFAMLLFPNFYGQLCATAATSPTCPLGPAASAGFATQIAREFATSAVFTRKFGQTYDNERDAFTNGVLFGTHLPGSALYIRNNLYAFNVNFDFDAMTLKLATGVTNSDYHGAVQVSVERPGSAQSASFGALVGSPAPVAIDAAGGLGFSSINPSKVFSQGIQLQSRDDAHVKWIGGADYSKEDGRVFQTGDGFGQSSVAVNDDFRVRSAAIYGQATIPLADSWSTTLGARYTDEEYSLHDRFGLISVPPLKGKKFTYTARVERHGNDWLAYGGISTGFKSGTLNAAGATLDGRAEPESVSTIEVGMKRDFANRYRLNAALYVSSYKDVQLNIIDQRNGGNVLSNGPKATVKGIDLQSVAKLTQNFQVSLGATILDAKFTENNPQLPNIKGNYLPGSARLAVSLVGDYNMPLVSGGALNLVTTVVHNSGKYYDHLNFVGSGGSTNAPYQLVNLNVEYKPANGHVTASIWGNNVLNKEYYRAGVVAFGTFGRVAIAGNPATFGASLKVSF
jgi:iron complex outermembrane receptor protein